MGKELAPAPQAEPRPGSTRACVTSPERPASPRGRDTRFEVPAVTTQELLGVLGGWEGGWLTEGPGNLPLPGANMEFALNKNSRSSSNPSPVCQRQKGAGDDSGGEENTKTQALSIDVRVKVGRWSAEYFYPNRGVICLSPMKCWKGVLSTQFMQRENSPSHS